MFETEIKIGKIVKIEGLSISIEIDKSVEVNKVLSRWNFIDYPVNIYKYFYSWLPNRKRIISRAVKVWDKDLFKEDNIFKNKIDSKFIVECVLIGIYDDITNKFESGINNFPIIHSEIFLLESDVYENFLNPSSKFKYKIGTSFYSDNIDIFANPNILLGKHLGVFGNTGTGKSCTVTSLIQGLKRRFYSDGKLVNNIKPKIIIFDANAEYENAFKGTDISCKIIHKEDLKLPHSVLSMTEYYRLFDASQGVQAPVLKEAINNLTQNGQFANLQLLPETIDSLIKCKGDKKDFSYNQWKSWVSTMVNRIERLLENQEIIRIINTKENVINEIWDSDFDVNIIQADFEQTELDIIIYLFNKIIYQKAISNRNNTKNILIVFEEAHRYINEEEYGYNKLGTYYIERLAREGRKFGVSLLISSQRPSELSKTVLSQCNSFIIHRITNRNDLEFISKTLSYSNSELLKIIPGLEKQYAVVVGEAFNYSDIVKIETADPTPDSKDPEVIENWINKKQTEINHEAYENTNNNLVDEIDNNEIPF